MNAALLYYTHNAKPPGFLATLYNRHRGIAGALGARWVAVTSEAIGAGDIVQGCVDGDPTYADIYRRILRGLDELRADDSNVVYLIEDDVIYGIEHFGRQGRGPEVFYNLSLAYMCDRGFYWHMKGAIALSQLCGTVKAMQIAIGTKLRECLERRLSCVEPAGAGYFTGTFASNIPNIDIRNGLNATWQTPADVKIIDRLPGWAPWSAMWPRYCGGLSDE